MDIYIYIYIICVLLFVFLRIVQARANFMHPVGGRKNDV
jgi:hypothetical protein